MMSPSLSFEMCFLFYPMPKWGYFHIFLCFGVFFCEMVVPNQCKLYHRISIKEIQESQTILSFHKVDKAVESWYGSRYIVRNRHNI